MVERAHHHHEHRLGGRRRLWRLVAADGADHELVGIDGQRGDIGRRHRDPFFEKLEVSSKLPICMTARQDDMRARRSPFDCVGDLFQRVLETYIARLRIIDRVEEEPSRLIGGPPLLQLRRLGLAESRTHPSAANVLHRRGEGVEARGSAQLGLPCQLGRLTATSFG